MSVVRKYRQFLLQLIDLAIWMAGAVLGMCVAANVTLIRIQVFAVIAAVHIIVYQFFFMYQVRLRGDQLPALGCGGHHLFSMAD